MYTNKHICPASASIIPAVSVSSGWGFLTAVLWHVVMHHFEWIYSFEKKNMTRCHEILEPFQDKHIEVWRCIYVAFFTQGQFWPSGIVIACLCLSVCQLWACLHDNMWTIQARITKFGPKVQTPVNIPSVLGGWLTLILKSKFQYAWFHHQSKYTCH